MVQVRLFEGWSFEREVNHWLEECKDFEIIDIKMQFVGPEDESYPYVLVIFQKDV